MIVSASIKEDILNGMLLEVQVADQGNGMNEETAARAFDLIAVDAHRAHQIPRGIRVGLHISKKICESLGGDISIATRVNIGTEVKFSMRVFTEMKPGMVRTISSGS